MPTDDSIRMVLRESIVLIVMTIIKSWIISHISVILFIDLISNPPSSTKYCCISHNYTFKLMNVMDDT